MDKHQWIIYGRGYVPENITSWLNDYNLNDFKIQSSGMEFTGTDQEFTQLIRQLGKNEAYFKVIGWDCLSDCTIIFVVDWDHTGHGIFMYDENTPDQRSKISPEKAYQIYKGANWNPIELTFDQFKIRLGYPDNVLTGKKISILIRKTKFASILNSQIETT